MSNPYMGTWRIIEMEQWDQDYIDLVVPGYIAFREDNLGEFQFGTVHGDIDFPIGGFSPPEGRLARGFKPPAFSRFLFQSAVKSAESF